MFRSATTRSETFEQSWSTSGQKAPSVLWDFKGRSMGAATSIQRAAEDWAIDGLRLGFGLQ